MEAVGCPDPGGQGDGDAHSYRAPVQVCSNPPIHVEVNTALSASRQQEAPPNHQGTARSLVDQESPQGKDVKKQYRCSPSIKHYFCVAERSLDHRGTGSTMEDIPASKRPKTVGADVGGEGQCKLCQRCQHWVPLDVWQEHGDFHLAQDLQQKLEAEQVREPRL